MCQKHLIALVITKRISIFVKKRKIWNIWKELQISNLACD